MLDVVLHHGREGEIYNIGAENEWPNLEIARQILRWLEKPDSLLSNVKDRPGHGRRYALDSRKIQAKLGWKPGTSFQEGLNRTIEWYVANTGWRNRIQSQEYLSYYQKQYDQRNETLAGIQNPRGRGKCASL